jgi:uncharacterized membrane protein
MREIRYFLSEMPYLLTFLDWQDRGMRGLIALAAEGVEDLAILVIVGGIAYSMVSYLVHRIHRKQQAQNAYRTFKEMMGKTLLLGLEFLVAADIIRTVALSPTLQNVVVLGVLVLIRTFLSWSIVVEIEGRWPWQSHGL